MNAEAHAPHHHDPSLVAPEYVRRIAPYLPGKPIAELAREFGLAERDIVKLASNENPRGPSPAVRAALAAATEELSRYPDGNGFELKAALAARYAIATEPDRAGQRLERRARARDAGVPPARRPRGLFAARVCGVSARHAGAGRDRHRGAGRRLRPRPCRHARGDHARDARRVRRQSEQSDRHVARTGRARALHRVGPRRRARGPRRGLQRVPGAGATGGQRGLGRPLSEPDRLADLFQGVRARGAARRLRRHGAEGGGHAEPGAAAVQCQCARPGRGARRAGRHRLRRGKPAPEPRRNAAARSGIAQPRTRLGRVARELPAGEGGRRGERLYAAAEARGDRAAGRQLRAAGMVARHDRIACGERALPRCLDERCLPVDAAAPEHRCRDRRRAAAVQDRRRRRGAHRGILCARAEGRGPEGERSSASVVVGRISTMHCAFRSSIAR